MGAACARGEKLIEVDQKLMELTEVWDTLRAALTEDGVRVSPSLSSREPAPLAEHWRWSRKLRVVCAVGAWSGCGDPPPSRIRSGRMSVDTAVAQGHGENKPISPRFVVEMTRIGPLQSNESERMSISAVFSSGD